MDSTTTRTEQARINPTPWPQRLGSDHGRLVTGVGTVLAVAGQGPLDAGGRLVHDGDPTAQLALAMANFESVLDQAGMSWPDVVQLRVHTTDLDVLADVHDTLLDRLAECGAHPPTTIVEVTRLLVPGMTVQLDGLAVR